jgi:two-component system, NtrC family, response regulator AtoC
MLEAVETAKGIGPKPVPVLISGETGTGKEVLANVIHETSQRQGRFVPVNCAALPKELVESELFGSVRGAFTGAHQDRVGLIKQADGGTLFLDEISELSNAMQAKLLRVLQEKRVRPVGQNEELKVDFRLIVALNVDPHELIARRKLRPDLFYRINVVNLHLPPLRERLEDILPLAAMFLAHYMEDDPADPPQLSQDVQKQFLAHPWPGNVRQLQNEMERLAALHSANGEITTKQLSAEFARSFEPVSALPPDNGSLDYHKRRVITETLARLGGNKVLTSEVLGIGRQTLYNLIKKYRLEGWVRQPVRRGSSYPPELQVVPVPMPAAPESQKPAEGHPAGSNGGDFDLL